MENQSLDDKLAAVAVSLLLILAAWGNAVVMLVFAMLGLVASALFFRKSMARGGALSATLGFALAIAISLVMLLR
jgi:hypothetical protein